YAFLDDAPLEERRTQAVITRRGLDVKTAEELGKLDQAAIDRVKEEAWPEVASADELHDALLVMGAIPNAEVGTRNAEQQGYFEELARAGRALVGVGPARPHQPLLARPAAPGDRAGHGGGLHAVPARVAARRTRCPGRGAGRAWCSARTARRIRGAGGGLGGGRAPRAARRLRPSVARRPVPVRGDRLGPVVAGGAVERGGSESRADSHHADCA